jgi:hypothetical protein
VGERSLVKRIKFRRAEAHAECMGFDMGYGSGFSRGSTPAIDMSYEQATA